MSQLSNTVPMPLNCDVVIEILGIFFCLILSSFVFLNLLVVRATFWQILQMCGTRPQHFASEAFMFQQPYTGMDCVVCQCMVCYQFPSTPFDLL